LRTLGISVAKMEEKDTNEYTVNRFLRELSKGTPSRGNRRNFSLSLRKTIPSNQSDSVKSEPAKKEKEIIRHEKYKLLSDQLSLWYTAQEQLRKGQNPTLCTKYGIRLNASKLDGKNKILAMLTELRRHTDLMTITNPVDPASANPENDEDLDELEVPLYGHHSTRSYYSFQETPRHRPVPFDDKGIV